MKDSSIKSTYHLHLLPIAMIALLSAVIFFAYLGNFPLFNPDEGLYAEPAREMLETGEYITTTLNYVVRFTKPPLVIWAMAIAYKIFGINEFAARLFCASSGFLLTLISYLFANKYLGRRIALFTAGILLTAPLFIGVGRMAITDMPLSLFIAGALFSFIHGYWQRKKLWLYLGYFLTALAVMTKGPIGLLLPILILWIFFFFRGQIKESIKFFDLPLGALIVGLISLPWFIVEIIITRGAYFQEFIMRENFARFTSVVDSHKGPWWYHLAAVSGGLFPWSILLPQSMITVIKTINPNQQPIEERVKWISSLINLLKSCKTLSRTNEILLFALITSVITISFFSISTSKLLPYTLPCFPFLAIIIAYQLNAFIENKEIKSILIYNIIMLLIFLIAIVASPIAFKFLRNAPSALISLTFYYSCIAAGIAILSIILAVRKQLFLSLIWLLSALTVNVAIFLPQFLSAIAQSWEAGIPEFSKIASQSKLPLVVYRLRKPGLPFYYRRPVIQCNDKDDLAHKVQGLSSFYLITNHKYLPETQLRAYKILSQNNNFVLLSFDK